MTNSSIIDAKRALRKQMRALRSSPVDCGDAHSVRLIELIVKNDFSVISAYEEFDNEPSLEFLRSWCGNNGVKVLLPQIANEDDLVWHYEGTAALLSEAELIIMPALAAGRDGNRLGRGKGYYDKAVAELSAPRVVVVHDEEVFDSVPADSFDQRVSMIVTCSESIDVDGRLN